MMSILQRHLTESVTRALATSRIVNIVGPRQAGKTTLVRDMVPWARYITLDDDGLRAALAADPFGQMQAMAEQTKDSPLPVVIDEVQRVPAITLALKRIVDVDTRPGRYVLTGSSDIFTAARAYDSLAGRVMTLALRPLSAAEITGAKRCRLLDIVMQRETLPAGLPAPRPFRRSEAIDFIVRGGFPEIRPLPDADRMARYASYLDSVVERDVADVAVVRKPDLLRRLVDQLAVRTAEELNVTALCGAVGARKETVDGYLDVLSRLGIIHRLGAWTASGSRREIRAPKLHFMDTGCATALRGEDSQSYDLRADPAALGHVLESFVFAELEKTLAVSPQRWRLYHWRWETREIDIIAEAPGRVLALFETKASTTVDPSDFRHLDWFAREGPGQSHACVGFVVYLGDQLLAFGPRRLALPISIFWSFTTDLDS